MLHGRKIVVLSASGTVAALAYQRSVEITKTCEMREIASNTADSQEFKPGRKGWQLMVSGLMSSLGDMLQEGASYTLQVTDGSTTQQGSCYCAQVKVTGVIGNLAQQSAVFQGTGAFATPSNQTS